MRFLLLLMLLFGCSTSKVLESIGIGSGLRIGVNAEHKPNFYVQNFSQIQGRSIASISSKDDSLTNKQIYFLGLYEQFHQLRNLIGVKDEYGSCPAFHNELLQFENLLNLEDKSLSLNITFTPVIEDPSLLASYPVMSLPYSGTDLYSYLKVNPNTSASAVVKEAIFEYSRELEKEVYKMCHLGVSNDYFVYENYVTYAPSDEKLVSSSAVLSATLKIPVFANILLLDNFRSQNFISSNVMSDALIDRAAFGWFKNYLYELEKIRQHKSNISFLHKLER